jgi:hypothetical protein
MKSPEKAHAEYLRHSKDCMMIARDAETPEEEIMLLHIAETWLRLAQQALGGRPPRVLH